MGNEYRGCILFLFFLSLCGNRPRNQPQCECDGIDDTCDRTNDSNGWVVSKYIVRVKALYCFLTLRTQKWISLSTYLVFRIFWCIYWTFLEVVGEVGPVRILLKVKKLPLYWLSDSTAQHTTLGNYRKSERRFFRIKACLISSNEEWPLTFVLLR
jgi:hypothetical protein